MHPAHIAKRKADALNRIRAASDRIAAGLGIDFPDARITPRSGPEVAQLQTNEMIADRLERIADAVEPQRESRPRGRKGTADAVTKGESGGESVHEAVPEVLGA